MKEGRREEKEEKINQRSSVAEEPKPKDPRVKQVGLGKKSYSSDVASID